MRRYGLIPRLVGEPGVVELFYSRSHIQKYADRMRRSPTHAERQLARILTLLNGGVLRGKFDRQHVVNGRWIVDFFFPEIHLAIEVDGSVHWSKSQRALDRKKEEDCAELDITLLRISNAQVFGDREVLVRRLREGWRMVLERENKIIGKSFPIASSKRPYLD